MRLIVCFIFFIVKSLCAQSLQVFNEPPLDLSSNDIITISTHNSAYWDIRKVGFNGVENLYHYSNKNNIPFVALRSCKDCESPFEKDFGNIIFHQSSGGEINLKHDARVIISFGGYPGACLYRTLDYLLINEGGNNIEKIIYITDAIFGETIFDRFISNKASRNLFEKGNYNLASVLEYLENDAKSIKFLKKFFRFSGIVMERDRAELLSKFNFKIHYKRKSAYVSKYSANKKDIDVFFIPSNMIDEVNI